jgi:sugar/nucleoside kinase (ribokinase family)
MIDIVQCNEAEMRGLTVEGLTEEKTVGHLFTLGVKGVMVTRGAGGVSLYRNVNKTTIHRQYEAPQVIPAVRSVGAGDAFGAATFYRFLKKKDLEEAVAAGIEAATGVLQRTGAS